MYKLQTILKTFLSVVLIVGFIPASEAALIDCSFLLFSRSQEKGTSLEKQGYKFEEVQIVTRDGVTLNSVLVHSRIQPPRGLVVQFHGQGGNSSQNWAYLNWLLDAGYDLLASEFRGHNRSGGKVSLAGALEDVQAGLNYANQMSESLNLPLIAIGHSIGGHLLFKAVSTVEYNHLRVVMTEGAPVSMLQTTQEIASLLPQPYRAMTRLSRFLIPTNTDLVPNELAQTGGFFKIVVHAPEDRVVSPAQGENLFSNLSEPKVFMENTKDEHIVGFSEPIRQQILDLLERHTTPRIHSHNHYLQP